MHTFLNLVNWRRVEIESNAAITDVDHDNGKKKKPTKSTVKRERALLSYKKNKCFYITILGHSMVIPASFNKK